MACYATDAKMLNKNQFKSENEQVGSLSSFNIQSNHNFTLDQSPAQTGKAILPQSWSHKCNDVCFSIDYLNSTKFTFVFDSHLNEILKNKPHSAEAYKLLSQIKEAEGDHEAAVMNYKKSLELNASQQQNLFFDHFNNIHTPTKMSSPLNNNSNNRSPDNSQVISRLISCWLVFQVFLFYQNDIERPSFTIEQVDQMFTAKLASIEKNFKDYFEFLKSTLLKNSAEISLIKVCVWIMNVQRLIRTL